MSREREILGRRRGFRWNPALLLDPELSAVFGGKYPYGNTAPFGGVPPYQSGLFAETFNYADGELHAVSGGRWSSALGTINVASGQAVPNSSSQYTGSDTLALWNLAAAWTAKARLSVGVNQAAAFGFEVGTTAPLTTEINALVNPCIIRSFNGAGGNSGNFSLGVATGTFDVVVKCSASRLLTVFVNGTQKYTYQLNATTGQKAPNILFTFNVAGGAAIDNLFLSQ